MKLLTTLTFVSFLTGNVLTMAQEKTADKAAKAEKTEKTEKAAKAGEHDHDHDHAAKKSGPTGGRVLTEVEPHAEFFINKDKKVEIRFVDDDYKVVAAAEQVVTVTLGDRTKPTKLTFTKDGDKLVSDKAVPEGNDYPTVVQIKTDAKAKAVTAKFNLNMVKCPTCPNLEYACVCDHDHDHDHDHAPAKDAKGAKAGKKDK